MEKINDSNSRNEKDIKKKITSKNSKQKSKSILNFLKKNLIKLPHPFKKKKIKIIKNEKKRRSLPCLCKKDIKTRECLMIKTLSSKIDKIGSKKNIEKKSFFKWKKKKIEIKLIKEILTEDEICKCCLIEDQDYIPKRQKNKKIPEKNSNKNIPKIEKNEKKSKTSSNSNSSRKSEKKIKKTSFETNSTYNEQILAESLNLQKFSTKKKEDFFTISSSLTDNKKDENHIKLDIIRTFQDLNYFKRYKIKEKLNLAISMISTISKTGYVQGMNYWIGGIIYHTKNEEYFLKISKFLFMNLNLERVYCFKTLCHYFEILEKLLKIKLPELCDLLDNNNCDIQLLLLDWFFCMGFNKVPLYYSNVLLNGLVIHGWYYFYRLIIVYLKYFKKFLKTKNNPNDLNLSDFNIQYHLKNFYKEKFLNWDKLLKKTKKIKLNSKIMNELIWENSYKFKKIKVIFNKY